MTTKVIVHFDNDRAAEHFASWLDGGGEHDYWVWMDAREYEEKGPITALTFTYNHRIVDGEINVHTELGRMDTVDD